MDNELKEKEYQKLLKLKKQYTIIVYIGLILSVLFIIFCYLNFETPMKAYISILGFFVINAVFIFVIAKENENKFLKLYDELIVKKVLNNSFENVSVILDTDNKHKINFINIFNEKTITTTNYVKCEYNKLPLEIIETKVKEFEENFNGDRTSSTSYNQIFNGLVYCYNLGKNNKGNVNIVSKYYLNDKDNVKIINTIDYKKTSMYDSSYKEVEVFEKNSLSKINLQNEEYGEWVSIYADCNINEKLLCNNILNLILELRRQVDQKIFIIIQDDMLYIGINNYYNLYKNDILSKKKKLEVEEQNLLTHIQLIKKILIEIQNEIHNIII